MTDLLLTLASALWLGVLTSISPCPLATNIAAISFISRRAADPRHACWTGLAYTLGRTLAYIALAAVIAASLLSIPVLSQWLQKYMNKLLGPVLVLVGMFLLEMIQLSFKGGRIGQWAQTRAGQHGLLGAVMLGAVFAISFCPVSAALFFGSLIPLAVKQHSYIVLPALYGVGTAVPVLVFALVIVFGVSSLGRLFEQVSRWELWARRITGGLFIAIGIYFTIAYTLR